MAEGAVGDVDAGMWRMNSAVHPCWARACALAPAVVAVSDSVPVLLTDHPREVGSPLVTGFLSTDSFRVARAAVVAVM
jgi:hypothetical protein